MNMLTFTRLSGRLLPVLASALAIVPAVVSAQISIQFNLGDRSPAVDGRLWQRGTLVNIGSGLCLAAEAGWGGEGADVVQDRCGNAGTRWSLQEVGDREYAIVNEDTGYVLDVTRSSREDGANIQQWGWNRSLAQRWRLVAVGRDAVQIVNVGSGKCLDVEGRGWELSGSVIQYRCTGESRQLWRLPNRDVPYGGYGAGITPLPPPIQPPVHSAVRPDGRLLDSGFLVSRATGKCVDLERGRSDEGANIRLWSCNRSDAQHWDLIDIGRGEVAFVVRASGKVMDAGGGDRFNDNVLQRSWNGNFTQRWRIEPMASGFSRIVSVGTGKCLDVSGARSEDGANIGVYPCHRGDNQQWRLERTAVGIAPIDPNPVAGGIGSPRPERPPRFALGVFAADAAEFGGPVELTVHADGMATLTLPNRSRMEGYFRNGLLYFGLNRYEVEETGNGFRARALGEVAIPIQFRRIR